MWKSCTAPADRRAYQTAAAVLQMLCKELGHMPFADHSPLQNKQVKQGAGAALWVTKPSVHGHTERYKVSVTANERLANLLRRRKQFISTEASEARMQIIAVI